MQVPTENPLIMAAILGTMEELGYAPFNIMFQEMDEDGYYVVIPDGKGDYLRSECEEHGHEDHPVLAGPIEWKEPEHWAIIRTYFDQAKDMADILEATDRMAETYSNLRSEFWRVLEQNTKPRDPEPKADEAQTDWHPEDGFSF